MRRFAPGVILAAALVSTAGPARAWLAYPPDDRPDSLIVEIDRQVADVVPLRSLPEPFARVLSDPAAANKLSYRWRYDRAAQGLATLLVDEVGRGKVRFEFAEREALDGVRYGAAMVLLGAGGTPLHTFYARADSMRKEGADTFARHRVGLELVRSPEWWRRVESIAFFRMTYHPSQRLNDLETWRAMRRAVGHLTKGQGTEQGG